jgi:hypothetical protein
MILKKNFVKSKGKALFGGLTELLLYFVNCILSLQPHESNRTFKPGAGNASFF